MIKNMNKERTIIIAGKAGTGKSQKALEMFEEPIVVYANEMNIGDVRSIDKDRGIIIEDIHFKPKKDEILYVLRNYRGDVVMTSINQKSVPSEIKHMCKFKRAGTVQYIQNMIKEVAPRSEEPFSLEKDMFSLVQEYLKNSNRDLIAKMLKVNRPADTQIMSWLIENMHPNRLLFVDGVVKRRWSSDYFYEMLAYNFRGQQYGSPRMPTRKAYSKIPNLCRRLGLRGGEERLLKQLLQDDEFCTYAKKKLNNGECRLLGIGEKKKSKPRKRVVKASLEKWL